MKPGETRLNWPQARARADAADKASRRRRGRQTCGRVIFRGMTLSRREMWKCFSKETRKQGSQEFENVEKPQGEDWDQCSIFLNPFLLFPGFLTFLVFLKMCCSSITRTSRAPVWSLRPLSTSSRHQGHGRGRQLLDLFTGQSKRSGRQRASGVNGRLVPGPSDDASEGAAVGRLDDGKRGTRRGMMALGRRYCRSQ